MIMSVEKKPKKRTRRLSTGNQTLDNYLDTIAESKPLSAEEEAVLARRIREGDGEARNKLVEANLRFVVSVAKEYRNRGLAMAELISVGNMGLITAAERFDETRGFKFISYAVWWIRQAIQHAIMEQNAVRLPANRVNMIAKIARTYSDLQQGDQFPDAEKVANILGFSEEKVEQYLHHQPLCCSLDAPVDGQEEISLLDQLCDENQLSPEEEMIEGDMREGIRAILASLNEREAEIIKLYFGLDGEQALTLEQIGERFSLTRERVRQIKERALNKLRRPSVYSRLS